MHFAEFDQYGLMSDGFQEIIVKSSYNEMNIEKAKKKLSKFKLLPHLRLEVGKPNGKNHTSEELEDKRNRQENAGSPELARYPLE